MVNKSVQVVLLTLFLNRLTNISFLTGFSYPWHRLAGTLSGLFHGKITNSLRLEEKLVCPKACLVCTAILSGLPVFLFLFTSLPLAGLP